MKRKWLFIVLLCAAYLAVIPSKGQTPSGLRKKYGAPDDKGRYVVRPDIVISAALAADQQPCKIKVEPQKPSPLSESADSVMKSDTVTEVLDELAPFEQRGKHLRSITFNAGCASMSTDEYERVSINRAHTCVSGGGVTSAEIRWKDRKCK